MGERKSGLGCWPHIEAYGQNTPTHLNEAIGVDPPMREGERERTGMGDTRLGELELVTREERDDRTPPTTSLVLGLSMLSSSDAPVNRSQYRSSMPARACPSPQLMRRVISESDREARARRSGSVVASAFVELVQQRENHLGGMMNGNVK